MPEQVTRFTADAPGLALLVEQLQRFITDDRTLRLDQSRNAPRPLYFGQQTITGATVFSIPEAQTGNQQFSGAVIMLDTPSGSARYLFDGTQPTAAGRGLPIPAGGTVIDLLGMENIKQLRIIAETLQTCNISYQVFQ